MRPFLVLILAVLSATPLRSESNVSILAAVPHGIDIQYEVRTGRHAFSLRTGVVQKEVYNLIWSDAYISYFPELSYGPLLQFGERSWLKPTLGLAYYYSKYEEDRISNRTSRILNEGIYLIPRLEVGKRFGWFKLTFEYGMTTSIERDDEERLKRPERWDYRFFSLQHAIGIAAGVFF